MLGHSLARLAGSALVAVVLPVLLLAGCSRRPRVEAVPVAEVAPTAGIAPAAPIAVGATDWPQWRGPRGDGTAGDADVPTTWDESTNVAWRADIPGRGHSSPIAVGATVYVATAITEPDRQAVVGIDRATGDKRFETVVHEGGFPDPSVIHRKATNANSTLACDGTRLFATFFNSGRVFLTALDLDGTRLWQRDVGAFASKFGYAPSPVLHGSTVIVAGDNAGGGYLAALHRETGDVVWLKSRPAVSTYSSPLVATIGGREQLVISGGGRLASHDPATGEELWSLDAIAEATCGTPVTDGDMVFASGGYPERETVGVDARGTKVWSNRTKVYEPSLLAAGGHLFAVDDGGVAWCWDAKTGKERWKQRIGGSFSASPVACGGRLLVPNLSGETVVFDAAGDAFREVARNTLGNDSYASIAVGGGELFLRIGIGDGAERREQVVCIRRPGVAAATAAEPRKRVVSFSPETPATEVNRYFSPQAHGPTKKFFLLAEERVVVLVATADGTADAGATVFLFPEETTLEGMERWINNLHSDALFPDAAEPSASLELPDRVFHASVGPALEHEVGPGGDEYDRVRVEFSCDAFEDGAISIKPSRGSLDAFIRTKDLPSR